MRFSLGTLASAAVLFVAGAVGALGTWALATATVLGLVGAVCIAIVMEERDHSSAVVTALADRRRPLVIEPLTEGTLDLLGH
jgi:hypothetical protein